MIRQRLRIRFGKQDDLRFLGHRDLVRVFERAFRRLGVPLSMSEGFHPKAKLSFPSALAVGIEGTDEMMDVEVCGPVAPPQLMRQLQQECPPGLHIYRLSALPAGTAKPQVTSFTYEIRVPAEDGASCQSAIEALLEQPTMWIERPGKGKPVDLRADLVDLCLAEGVLRITQRVSPAASARPREILRALGISHLEAEGHRLQRTAVRLADRTQPRDFLG